MVFSQNLLVLFSNLLVYFQNQLVLFSNLLVYLQTNWFIFKTCWFYFQTNWFFVKTCWFIFQSGYFHFSPKPKSASHIYSFPYRTFYKRVLKEKKRMDYFFAGWQMPSSRQNLSGIGQPVICPECIL